MLEHGRPGFEAPAAFQYNVVFRLQMIDMSLFRMLSLALAAVVGLVACGGADETAQSAQSKSASSTMATEARAEVAAEPVSFNNANAVTQPAMAAAQTDPGPVASVKLDTNSARKAGASVDLGAPSAAQQEQRTRKNQRTGAQLSAKAYQTGFPRPIASASDSKSLRTLLKWTTTETSAQRASLSLRSTGARGIRLGLLVQQIPNDAVFRFYASGSSEAIQTTGKHINSIIQANLKTDGDSQAARTYWTPTTLGETSVLEVELPVGGDTSSVIFSIPILTHLAETAVEADLALIREKATCALTPQATCTDPLPPAANAVAAMDFVDGEGYGGACTGTLIANRGATQQGYFLTANHCINTQAAASSLTTYWFYRSNGCGQAASTYTPDANGSTLLFNRPELSGSARTPIGTDTSLLKLNALPPAGAVYAGWNFQRHAINTGTNYIGLHHPFDSALNPPWGFSDSLRRSDGRLTNYAVLLSGNEAIGYTSQSGANASYPMYQVTFNSGITEGGSSGSALFADGLSANPRIIGQLWGGSSSCVAPTAPDLYGRFDLAYENGLINWLNPGYRMVFRFYNSSNGSHFFSANVSERDTVRLTIPSLIYEDPVFMVSPATGSGLSPVYRFYNRNTGVHFYTINESERALVMTMPTFNYEGVAWYARQVDNPAPESIPVYRFLRRSTGTHLYTANTAERNNIINTMSATYAYEGVAYLAWAAN